MFCLKGVFFFTKDFHQRLVSRKPNQVEGKNTVLPFNDAPTEVCFLTEVSFYWSINAGFKY